MLSVTRALWLIIGISLAIHVLTLLVGQLWLYDWLWQNPTLHSSIEMSGSVIALVVAIFLIYFQRFGRGTSYNMQIAAALLCMGVLDGFHAMLHVGEAFVWLHSMATFLAGVCFFSIFFPTRWRFFSSVYWPVSACVFAVIFGGITLIFHHQVPAMVQQGEFTALAKGLNFVGGVMLFIAALGLVQSYFRTGVTNDLLFCLHCSLFGAAAIMFEQSELWDLPWWGWHLLRFLAYMVALWFVFRDESLLLTELSTHRDKLDLLVDERTSQLHQSNQNLELALQHLHNTQLQTSESMSAAGVSNALEELSYEVNAPLTNAMTGASQIRPWIAELRQSLRDDAPNEQELEHLLCQLEQQERRVRCNLDEAMQRVNDLQLADLEKADLNKVSMDVQSHVETALSVLNDQLEARQITIDLICPDPVSIRSYPGALAQVVNSLVMNSLQHAFPDGRDGHIKVDIRANPDGLQLLYSDNGCGIEPQVLDRVFEPFFTTSQGESSGLGLYICHNLVSQKLAGHLSCQSKLGEGTQFTLQLPYDIEAEPVFTTS